MMGSCVCGWNKLGIPVLMNTHVKALSTGQVRCNEDLGQAAVNCVKGHRM